jgi:hypothetical protein
MKRIHSIIFVVLVCLLSLQPAVFIQSARAAISTNEDSERYSLNGTTVDFAFDWPVHDTSEIRVIVYDLATREPNVLTENSDYTIDLPNDDGFAMPGGTLTLVDAKSSDYELYFYRVPSLGQADSYANLPTITPKSFETSLDKLAKQVQYLYHLIGRAMLVPETDVNSFADIALPGSIERASTYLYFDANGVPSTQTNNTDLIVGTDAQAWDDDLDDIAALTPTLGHQITGDGTNWTGQAKPVYDNRDYDNIAAAITAIGATSGTLVISDVETLTANATFPATLSVVINKGGMITKASTYTCTLDGPFEAGLYQVFSGFDAGDVTLSSGAVEVVKPEWWGALADSSTDSTLAIQSAVESGITLIQLSKGEYLASNITLDDALDAYIFQGCGRSNLSTRGTRLTNNDTTPLIKSSETGTLSYVSLRDLSLAQVDGTAGHLLGFAGDVIELDIQDIYATLKNPASSFFSMITAGERVAKWHMQRAYIIAQQTGGCTVPAIDIVATRNTFSLDFRDIYVNGGSGGTGDASQAPLIRIHDDSTNGNSGNILQNILVEVSPAGAIDLGGMTDITLINVCCADSSVALTQSLIKISNGSSGQAGNHVLINCNASGGDPNYNDIELAGGNATLVLIGGSFNYVKSVAFPVQVIGHSSTLIPVGATVFTRINPSGYLLGVAGISTDNSVPTIIEKRATISLSNADIKALATTPITLAAAPGANKWLEFVSAVLILNYGSEVLAEPSAPDDLAIRYINGSGILVATWDTTPFITINQDALINVFPAFFGTSAGTVVTGNLVNKPLVLVNTGTDYTGNASEDTTMQIEIVYRLHTSLGL